MGATDGGETIDLDELTAEALAADTRNASPAHAAAIKGMISGG